MMSIFLSSHVGDTRVNHSSRQENPHSAPSESDPPCADVPNIILRLRPAFDNMIRDSNIGLFTGLKNTSVLRFYSEMLYICSTGT